LACSLYSQERWNSHFEPNCMHSRLPFDPSEQITPIKGISPQPLASGHGVVLRGGAHTERQTQAPSFSLPHAAPLNVVPSGQTLASGSAPHSEAGHWRYEVEPFGSGSDQPHDPAEGMHSGFSDLDDGGISPHEAALHGAMKLRPVRAVSVSSPPVPFPSPPFGGVVVLLEHATRRRKPRKEE